MSGDSFTRQPERVAGENVGSYAIAGHAGAGSNYALTFVGANLTINARAITVTADAKSKTYGDDDPTLTYQISGYAAGTDSFTGSLAVWPARTSAATRSAGHAERQQQLRADLRRGEPDDQRTGAVTVTADAKTKTYGDDDPALTYRSARSTARDTSPAAWRVRPARTSAATRSARAH